MNYFVLKFVICMDGINCQYLVTAYCLESKSVKIGIIRGLNKVNRVQSNLSISNSKLVLNYCYLKVNFLVLEKLLWDIRFLK